MQDDPCAHRIRSRASRLRGELYRARHCRSRANHPPRDEVTVAATIPARWASTRFPGKPLFPILGKALIQHVWERCLRAKSLSQVIIATDDMRIAEAAFDFGAEVSTSPKHPSGTDRVAQVAAKLPHSRHIINVQGDEPARAAPHRSACSGTPPSTHAKNGHRGKLLRRRRRRSQSPQRQSRHDSTAKRLFLPQRDSLRLAIALNSPALNLSGTLEFTVTGGTFSCSLSAGNLPAGAHRTAGTTPCP